MTSIVCIPHAPQKRPFAPSDRSLLSALFLCEVAHCLSHDLQNLNPQCVVLGFAGRLEPRFVPLVVGTEIGQRPWPDLVASAVGGIEAKKCEGV